MDIIVKYLEGQTKQTIARHGKGSTMFTNSFYLSKAGRPLFEKGKSNRVFHLEGDFLIGYSVPCDRGMIYKGQITIERYVSGFKWIEPIPFWAGIKLYYEFVEMPEGIADNVKLLVENVGHKST